MSSTSLTQSHILIVGGGFAGLALLLRLLRDSRQPLKISVAEPRANLGWGVAYSTSNEKHLLNGPARVFSVYADDPGHFVRWLQAQGVIGGWQPESGVQLENATPPRAVYGQYLSATLEQALASASAGVSVSHVRERVVGIKEIPEQAGYVATFEEGATLEATHVVLATGVFCRKKLPFEYDEHVLSSSAYTGDPWEAQAWNGVEQAERVVFLGSGLSALDALISAEHAGFSGEYVALSRRGQVVHARREADPWPEFLEYDLAQISSRKLLQQISAQRRLVRQRGEDWQRLVPTIKNHVARLWEHAPRHERKRFLKRLRRFWEAALHRSASEPLALQQRVQSQGRYRNERGQVQRLRTNAAGRIEVEYRVPDTQRVEVLVADRVVNCLGFEFDWQQTEDPLIRHLLDSGLVQANELGFGIEVSRERLQAIDSRGRLQPNLYALGHPLRGSFWESNAIPEQVPQAAIIARSVLDDIAPLARVRRLSHELARGAEEADRTNTLSLPNIEAIREAGIAALAVPQRLGGLGQDLKDVLAVIGALGRADPSTALIVLMQVFHHRWILASPHWPASLRETVLRGAVQNGDLINALRVEPVQGSPVRGGLPATQARRVTEGWRITGRKIYSTGAEVLRWGLVWASTDEEQPRVGEFLVPMNATGVRIEKSWDHLGLRGSGSHDVVFDDVLVPFDHGADVRLPQQWQAAGGELGAWLPLMLAALYDGVARNARDWLVNWSRQRTPSNLAGAISELPRFRAGVGEADALLLSNSALLNQVAQSADSAKTSVNAGLVKLNVTRNAIEVVQQVLALAGNHGLTRHNPVERNLRDVLCSRVHHPQDDLILDQAGRFAFERALTS